MSLLVFVGPNTTPDVEYFIDKFDKSILFEPSSESYRELCNRYPKREGLEIINAGCGATDGVFDFHSYNGGLSSSFATVTDEAKQVFTGREWSGEIEQARMINLGDFLRSRGIEEIDFLIIDAQGYDLQILKTIESFLKSKSIKKVQTEADHRGFCHYEGVENSFSLQQIFMLDCGYVCVRRIGHPHLDLTWEPYGNENQIVERLERTFCGLCV